MASKFEWDENDVTYTPPPEDGGDGAELQKEIDRITKILEEAGGDPDLVEDSGPAPLYVQRKVLNSRAIHNWAKAAGFTDLVPVEDLHVTLCYSRTPVDWMEMGAPWDEKLEIPAGGPRVLETFGEAQVLLFASHALRHRHDEFVRSGASFDYDKYRPHITLSYGQAPTGAVQAYQGPIVLGPEIFEELRDEGGSALS